MWPQFFYDSNALTMTVPGVDAWKHLIRVSLVHDGVSRVERVLQSRCKATLELCWEDGKPMLFNRRSRGKRQPASLPSFGSRREHRGDVQIVDWLSMHGIDPHHLTEQVMLEPMMQQIAHLIGDQHRWSIGNDLQIESTPVIWMTKNRRVFAATGAHWQYMTLYLYGTPNRDAIKGWLMVQGRPTEHVSAMALHGSAPMVGCGRWSTQDPNQPGDDLSRLL